MSRYLQHITLTTGDTRQSWRHEVADDLMPMLTALIESAREDGRALLPGLQPQCWLRIEDTSKCAIVNIDTADRVPLVTMAIATHSRCGAKLWRLLHETARIPAATDALRTPPEPWIAARLEPGIATLTPDATMALGDLERCIAWAWIESRERVQ